MKTINRKWRERSFFFLLGVLSLVGIGLLLGAADYKSTTLNYGRYQLSSWATKIGDDSGIIGAFVMDTVSGETRTVYVRTYGEIPTSRTVINDMKKPFHAINN